MFKLIKKDVKQLVKPNKPKHEIREVKDAAVSNREEINKLKEEIEAINRTLEIEKRKTLRKDILNKLLILINLVLTAVIFYMILKK